MVEISLHTLKPFQKKRKRKIVGRGDGSGHGTYSGRGQKGQKSRSGGRGGLKLKALRKIWKKIPKLGGFKSLKEKIKIFNLENLEKIFSPEEKINPKTLLAKGLINDIKEEFKILGKKLEKKLEISAHHFSKSAEEAIKKAGGKVIKF